MIDAWTRAAHARNLWGSALSLGYRLTVHGAHQVQPPVIVLFRMAGPLTIPALRSALPCPVHVVGADVDYDAPGIGAAKVARDALAQGRAVAVAEHVDLAAFLVARSGLPLCPVVIRGAHGQIATDPPKLRSHLDVYVGAPVAAPKLECGSSGLHAAQERIRQVLADADRAVDHRRGAA